MNTFDKLFGLQKEYIKLPLYKGVMSHYSTLLEEFLEKEIPIKIISYEQKGYLYYMDIINCADTELSLLTLWVRQAINKFNQDQINQIDIDSISTNCITFEIYNEL